jgi:hypothetical protein
VNDVGLNSVGDALGAGEIGRDDCGRQSIFRCVGERDRLLVIPECRDRCDRSKDLFVLLTPISPMRLRRMGPFIPFAQAATSWLGLTYASGLGQSLARLLQLVRSCCH